MGLKRRHKKKNNKVQKDQGNQNDQIDQKDQNNENNQSKGFDPQRVVKLDHKRKCFVVDEAPRFPLIATPRQLQKRFHYFSESSSDSDNNEELNSDDELDNTEYVMSSRTDSKDLIRVSSDSSDSGFEGGGTAPANPKKKLGKKYKYTMSVQKFQNRKEKKKKKATETLERT